MHSPGSSFDFTFDPRSIYDSESEANDDDYNTSDDSSEGLSLKAPFIGAKAATLGAASSLAKVRKAVENSGHRSDANLSSHSESEQYDEFDDEPHQAGIDMRNQRLGWEQRQKQQGSGKRDSLMSVGSDVVDIAYDTSDEPTTTDESSSVGSSNFGSVRGWDEDDHRIVHSGRMVGVSGGRVTLVATSSGGPPSKSLSAGLRYGSKLDFRDDDSYQDSEDYTDSDEDEDDLDEEEEEEEEYEEDSDYDPDHILVKRDSISWSGEGVTRGVWATLAIGDLIRLNNPRMIEETLIAEVSQCKVVSSVFFNKLSEEERADRTLEEILLNPKSRAQRELQKESTIYRFGFPTMIESMFDDPSSMVVVSGDGDVTPVDSLNSSQIRLPALGELKDETESLTSFDVLESAALESSGRSTRTRSGSTRSSSSGISVVSELSVPDFITEEIRLREEAMSRFKSFFHGPVYLSTFQLPFVGRVDISGDLIDSEDEASGLERVDQLIEYDRYSSADTLDDYVFNHDAPGDIVTPVVSSDEDMDVYAGASEASRSAASLVSIEPFPLGDDSSVARRQRPFSATSSSAAAAAASPGSGIGGLVGLTPPAASRLLDPGHDSDGGMSDMMSDTTAGDSPAVTEFPADRGPLISKKRANTLDVDYLTYEDGAGELGSGSGGGRSSLPPGKLLSPSGPSPRWSDNFAYQSKSPPTTRALRTMTTDGYGAGGLMPGSSSEANSPSTAPSSARFPRRGRGHGRSRTMDALDFGGPGGLLRGLSSPPMTGLTGAAGASQTGGSPALPKIIRRASMRRQLSQQLQNLDIQREIWRTLGDDPVSDDSEDGGNDSSLTDYGSDEESEDEEEDQGKDEQSTKSKKKGKTDQSDGGGGKSPAKKKGSTKKVGAKTKRGSGKSEAPLKRRRAQTTADESGSPIKPLLRGGGSKKTGSGKPSTSAVSSSSKTTTKMSPGLSKKGSSKPPSAETIAEHEPSPPPPRQKRGAPTTPSSVSPPKSDTKPAKAKKFSITTDSIITDSDEELNPDKKRTKGLLDASEALQSLKAKDQKKAGSMDDDKALAHWLRKHIRGTLKRVELEKQKVRKEEALLKKQEKQRRKKGGGSSSSSSKKTMIHHHHHSKKQPKKKKLIDTSGLERLFVIPNGLLTFDQYCEFLTDHLELNTTKYMKRPLTRFELKQMFRFICTSEFPPNLPLPKKQLCVDCLRKEKMARLDQVVSPSIIHIEPHHQSSVVGMIGNDNMSSSLKKKKKKTEDADRSDEKKKDDDDQKEKKAEEEEKCPLCIEPMMGKYSTGEYNDYGEEIFVDWDNVGGMFVSYGEILNDWSIPVFRMYFAALDFRIAFNSNLASMWGPRPKHPDLIAKEKRALHLEKGRGLSAPAAGFTGGAGKRHSMSAMMGRRAVISSAASKSSSSSSSMIPDDSPLLPRSRSRNAGLSDLGSPRGGSGELSSGLKSFQKRKSADLKSVQVLKPVVDNKRKLLDDLMRGLAAIKFKDIASKLEIDVRLHLPPLPLAKPDIKPAKKKKKKKGEKKKSKKQPSSSTKDGRMKKDGSKRKTKDSNGSERSRRRKGSSSKAGKTKRKKKKEEQQQHGKHSKRSSSSSSKRKKKKGDGHSGSSTLSSKKKKKITDPTGTTSSSSRVKHRGKSLAAARSAKIGSDPASLKARSGSALDREGRRSLKKKDSGSSGGTRQRSSSKKRDSGRSSAVKRSPMPSDANNKRSSSRSRGRESGSGSRHSRRTQGSDTLAETKKSRSKGRSTTSSKSSGMSGGTKRMSAHTAKSSSSKLIKSKDGRGLYRERGSGGSSSKTGHRRQVSARTDRELTKKTASTTDLMVPKPGKSTGRERKSMEDSSPSKRLKIKKDAGKLKTTFNRGKRMSTPVGLSELTLEDRTQSGRKARSPGHRKKKSGSMTGSMSPTVSLSGASKKKKMVSASAASAVGSSPSTSTATTAGRRSVGSKKKTLGSPSKVIPTMKKAKSAGLSREKSDELYLSEEDEDQVLSLVSKQDSEGSTCSLSSVSSAKKTKKKSSINGSTKRKLSGAASPAGSLVVSSSTAHTSAGEAVLELTEFPEIEVESAPIGGRVRSKSTKSTSSSISAEDIAAMESASVVNRAGSDANMLGVEPKMMEHLLMPSSDSDAEGGPFEFSDVPLTSMPKTIDSSTIHLSPRSAAAINSGSSSSSSSKKKKSSRKKSDPSSASPSSSPKRTERTRSMPAVTLPAAAVVKPPTASASTTAGRSGGSSGKSTSVVKGSVKGLKRTVSDGTSHGSSPRVRTGSTTEKKSSPSRRSVARKGSGVTGSPSKKKSSPKRKSPAAQAGPADPSVTSPSLGSKKKTPRKKKTPTSSTPATSAKKKRTFAS